MAKGTPKGQVNKYDFMKSVNAFLLVALGGALEHGIPILKDSENAIISTVVASAMVGLLALITRYTRDTTDD